jgi:putative acetyltransferase
MHVLIRRESDNDVASVRAVTAAAFGRPGLGNVAAADVVEATLVDELRASQAWLPAYSLVAVDRGEVSGHVLCTRGHVDAVPVLALGPLSVHPDRQAAGVGTALMHAVLGAAEALGEPLVALLGSPAYYARFGFRLSAEYRIAPPRPEWRAHFQVRTLSRYRAGITGTFRYPEPFDRT